MKKTYLETLLKKGHAYMKKEDHYLIFFLTIVIAFLAHLWIFTNQIPNADSVVYSVYYGYPNWEVSLGRFFQPVLIFLRGSFALPSVVMMTILLALGFTSILFVDLFKIKSKIGKCLLSAMVAVFPTVSAVLIYYYAADTYIIAQFLVVLAVWLSLRETSGGGLLAVILLTLSLGIYQSYFCLAIALYFLILLKEVLTTKVEFHTFFKKVIRYLVIGVSSLISYFIVRELVLYFMDIRLASYFGMNDMHVSLSILLNCFKECYYQFARFFFGTGFLYNSIYRKIAYFILWLCFAISLFFIVKKNKQYQNKGQFFLLVFMLILLPVVFYVTIFMILGVQDLKLRMLPQLQLFFLFMLAIIEEEGCGHLWIKDLTYLVTFFLVCSYFVLTSATYTMIQFNKNKAVSLGNRIISRIEMDPSYTPGMRVAMVGGIRSSNYPNINPELTKVVGGMNSTEFEILYDNSRNSWRTFVRDYLGSAIPIVEDKELNVLKQKKEVKEMKTFPNRDSIRVVDGVMVVKLSDN